MLQHWASEISGSDIITAREKERKDQLEVGTTSFFGKWMTHQQKQTNGSCGRCEGRKRGKRRKRGNKKKRRTTEKRGTKEREKPEERKQNQKIEERETESREEGRELFGHFKY